MLCCAGVLLAVTPHRHRRMCAEFEQGRVRTQWGWNVLILVAVFFAAGTGALTVSGVV